MKNVNGRLQPETTAQKLRNDSKRAGMMDCKKTLTAQIQNDPKELRTG